MAGEAARVVYHFLSAPSPRGVECTVGSPALTSPTPVTWRFKRSEVEPVAARIGPHRTGQSWRVCLSAVAAMPEMEVWLLPCEVDPDRETAGAAS
jgi:hypothetical protein